jgi:hypothetical protein
VQVVAGTTDRRWTPPQRVGLDDVTVADGGRTELFASAQLQDDLYGLFTPEGSVTRDGEPVFLAEQAPEFVPVPTAGDLPDTDDEPLADLTDVSSAELVGKSNAALAREYGLAVEGAVGPGLDADRPAGTEVGRIDEAGPVELVSSSAGALFEVGRLARGERVTVYGDAEFQVVPGRYAGLPYVRFGAEHARMDRPSWLLLGLAARSDVFVAHGGDAPPDWLADWTDTGHALGATDGVRTVARRTLDAGRHWLGGVPGSDVPYVVFARER